MTLQDEFRPSRLAITPTLRTTSPRPPQRRQHQQRPRQQAAVTVTSTRWAEYPHTCDALSCHGSGGGDVDADIISHSVGFQDTATWSRSRYKLGGGCKKSNIVIDIFMMTRLKDRRVCCPRAESFLPRSLFVNTPTSSTHPCLVLYGQTLGARRGNAKGGVETGDVFDAHASTCCWESY
jgi:hypothetical protein